MASPSTTAALPLRRPLFPLRQFLLPAFILVWLLALGLCLWRESQTWLDRVLDAPVLICLALFPILLLFEVSGLIRMFGPVLYYDLVRQARRLRYVLIRFFYAAGLFLAVCWVYWQWQLEFRYRQMRPSDLAEFGQEFFYTFLVLQTLLVLILTPAYTAGAITDEKEKKTLQFLLATDLYDREIIFSKLLSRLINIILAVLVGLPILSILQLIGGIDPNLLIASFIATASVVASLASVSLFNSTLLKRSRDAIILSYLTPPIYVLLSTVARFFFPFLLTQLGLAELLQWPGTDVNPAFISLQTFLNAFSAGDPFYIMEVFDQSQTPGSTLSMWDLTRNFALFHGYIAIVCVGGSLLLLRRQALKEASETVKKTRLWPRPAIGKAAMIWKEVWAERGLQFHLVAKIALAGLVLLSFVPAAYIVYDYMVETSGYGGYYGSYRRFQNEMNGEVRFVGTCVASLLLLGVAVRAAGSITSERDKQTLDTLLTTPLESSEIIFAKVLGAVASMRWMWLWLIAHWLLALVTGGLSLLAIPLLCGLWLVYAVFAALVGVWYSMTMRGTVGATSATLSTLMGLAFGHWLIWMCCGPLIAFSGGGGRDSGIEVILKFQAGLTPPFALGICAFHAHSFNESEQIEFIAYSLFATGVWVAGCVGLWALVNDRFASLTKRTPESMRPDFPGVRIGSRPRRQYLPVEELPEVPEPDKPTSIYRPELRIRKREEEDE